MALQWTPLRPQPNVFSRVRQSVEHLEHQTQSNVLLTFKLMVSGNGSPRTDSPFATLRSRKMTDKGVQCELDPDADAEPDILLAIEHPTTNCTIAEINTTEPNVTPTRPLSVEFTNSLGRERRRTICENVDEIVVQPLNCDEKTETEPKVVIIDKTEVDGVKCRNEKSCCVDCLYFGIKCCECTIL